MAKLPRPVVTIVADQVDQITEHIRDSLKQYIGQRFQPELVHRIKASIHHTLQDFMMRTGNIEKDEISSLVDLFAPMVVGIQEGFDPKALLENVSTWTLQSFAERLGPDAGFPGNLIYLEAARRLGTIESWSFERHDAHSGSVNYVLKEPLKHVVLEGTLDTESN